jgi:cell wall-associated NlpC family hydrolase
MRAPPLPKGDSSLTDRTRFALLVVVIVATVAARVGGALGATTASAQAKDAKVVAYAKHYLGVRYVWGGTSPATGFDCSGFTRFVYAHFGVALPHYSGGQFAVGRRVSRVGLRPGDLVFFDGLGHVGVYIGGGRFIHAPHSGARVSIDTLAHHGRYDGARRLI